MNHKKVIVAVSLEDELFKALGKIRDIHLDPSFEIHLVHVFPVLLYARGMQLSTLTYPLEEERPKIEKFVMDRLSELEKENFSSHKVIHKKCIFGFDERALFNEYVEEVQGDIVVVATRRKHHAFNFFDSSFAQHQLKYSPASVLILR